VSDATDSNRGSQLERVRQELLSEQNLAAGIAAGMVAALVGAALWAGITFATGYQLGIVAIAIGFCVGYAIRLAGKGISSVFGVFGAVLSLLGCAIGNLLALTALLADAQGIPFADALSRLDVDAARELLLGYAGPMDLLYYAISAYEGYKLSFREIEPAELERRLGHSAGA
jgi:hypothetical protein